MGVTGMRSAGVDAREHFKGCSDGGEFDDFGAVEVLAHGIEGCFVDGVA